MNNFPLWEISITLIILWLVWRVIEQQKKHDVEFTKIIETLQKLVKAIQRIKKNGTT